MRNLIIIGARGFGRDVFNLAMQCSGYNVDYRIKGFLDINENALDDFQTYPEILGSYENYNVETSDVFICAFGDVRHKKKAVESIRAKGGEFITLLHPAANIEKNSKIGNGCIILQNAGIGAGSIIGNYALIQVSTIIGHDSRVGNYSRIDCNAVCVGGVVVEDEVTIHTSAVINHKVVVGKGATVGALSFVIRNVKENSTVYGNPAVRLK